MKKNTRFLCEAAIIAAVYAALNLLLRPISFGVTQFRAAEALTLLPVLTPAAVPGLAVGCILSNISSPYGLADIIFGSAATLLSALCSRKTRNIRIKKLPVLSAVFPTVFNAVFVGAEITFLSTEGFMLKTFFLTAASVFLSEAVICFLLGVPLCRAVERTDIFNERL